MNKVSANVERWISSHEYSAFTAQVAVDLINGRKQGVAKEDLKKELEQLFAIMRRHFSEVCNKD